ncbi:maleylpyruvate isomerase family mycothiol-dependent enzyme [Nocardia arizonensis]|uniref:maleylpyruvate isomerase family mycothiol-dependent enzyme n=1 Tax=Nocardia arizonensis TaxID=1141647 RepID=UPI000A911462|nr:maleylpyruvate isomerase family mycothiol-dependent enzyme [Nocardia arizonensis]
MTTPITAVHRAALTAETDALAELMRTADPATPIPACPGWSLANLGTHVGRGHRWAAAMIADRATGPLDFRAVPEGAMPKDAEDAARWLSESAVAVLDAVDATGAEVPIWIPFGPARRADWWIRRRLHEATVHRADVLIGLGRTVDLSPALASDGISEWLDVLTEALRTRQVIALPDGATMHLHATDPDLGTDGEWTIRPEGASIEWEHGHDKGSVAVRGTAVALLLALLRRIPADDPGLDIHGDTAVLAHWLEHTPF